MHYLKLFKISHTKNTSKNRPNIFYVFLLMRNFIKRRFMDVKKLSLIFLRHNKAVATYAFLKSSYFVELHGSGRNYKPEICPERVN